ncbi:MAG: hypothetical protein UX93_C0001G0146 [Microgenomates group bacterium GW2011_GWC1_47_20]|uniref:Uncharacterized protein n=1 Tax=Candidatus Amesbacteria bacterium GW2011_GWC2_45_19 TaxID=1618366 RepID=A0A0G1M5A5_9BACT|nr:MAG: hypothetical protein UX05_C0001G0085 [Candidatus Amesbacteria bacterium GW2011_GWC2_45_19]KKU69561.1 MAG: hypothetical protein UX93_C0001G0146 [Microgenomates group bacterium GW2011_GWC1_47_20]
MGLYYITLPKVKLPLICPEPGQKMVSWKTTKIPIIKARPEGCKILAR